MRALAQYAADGALVRWVGMNVDIDDQRRADEAREQFVCLVEASDDLIGFDDVDGNAAYVNGAGRRLLGLGTLDEARGLRFTDLFMADDRALSKRKFYRRSNATGIGSANFACGTT